MAIGTFGLGVRTTYGSGIDPSLGIKVERDFLADQDAEAQAVTTADVGPLGGRLVGNALEDVAQQITDQAAKGPPPSVSFEPSSLTILRAQDQSDPSLLVKVEEDGSKTITTAGGPNSVPTQQTISFHGDFWLRPD